MRLYKYDILLESIIIKILTLSMKVVLQDPNRNLLQYSVNDKSSNFFHIFFAVVL